MVFGVLEIGNNVLYSVFGVLQKQTDLFVINIATQPHMSSKFIFFIIYKFTIYVYVCICLDMYNNTYLNYKVYHNVKTKKATWKHPTQFVTINNGTFQNIHIFPPF